ncbi:MAG: DUF3089 domain-containing protein [Flavobacteriales bacterium]|nr:DUF3089 domain-containing protein [Flavobacteriales bacterium]
MIFKYSFVFIVLISATSCIRITYTKPCYPFESYQASLEPDYAKESSWAALPNRKDNADLVPDNSLLKNSQDSALADVFYIHPTSYNGEEWNASIENKKINKRTDNLAIRHQASIFNESCKIYAPRYRQATLYSFIDQFNNGEKAIDLAYQDIKRAFEYYLNHWNKNRPIIIAAHSQGTAHALQLIKDYFDGTPLGEQLVVAYLVGIPIRKDAFLTIAPCNYAEETGCFVSWITFAWNKKSKKFEHVYKTNLPLYQYNHNSINCTNPLSWTNDTIYQAKTKNKGSVPASFKKIEKQVCDAQSYDGVLWIHLHKNIGYPSFPNGNFHPVDYNLFYMNIRENVKQRIDTYFKSKN